MIQGKKGEVEAQKVTMSLLILIVIVLVLAFFSARVFDWMTSKGDVESCRLSVVASGKISDVSLGISTLDLECPRKTIVLSPESYTVDESEKDYASEDEEDYSENVKQVFADEMRECWYKMGEGEVDMFDDNILYGFDDICVVCSHIEFEHPSEESVGNFATYLQETAIPLSVQQQEGITYYNYIYRQSPIGECSQFSSTGNIGITNNGEIDTSKPYDILFKAHHYEFLGVDYQCNSILVGPTETIAQAGCDYTYS